MWWNNFHSFRKATVHPSEAKREIIITLLLITSLERLISSKYIINYKSRVVLMESVIVHRAGHDCVLSDKDIYKTSQNCLSFGMDSDINYASNTKE